MHRLSILKLAAGQIFKVNTLRNKIQKTLLKEWTYLILRRNGKLERDKRK